MVMTGPLLVVGLISAVASGVAAAPFFDLGDDLLSDIFYWDYDSEEEAPNDTIPQTGTGGHNGHGSVINNGVVVTINGVPGGSAPVNNAPAKPSDGSSPNSNSNGSSDPSNKPPNSTPTMNNVSVIMNAEAPVTTTMASNGMAADAANGSSTGPAVPGAKG